MGDTCLFPEKPKFLSSQEVAELLPDDAHVNWVREHHEELGGQKVGGRIVFLDAGPEVPETWYRRMFHGKEEEAQALPEYRTVPRKRPVAVQQDTKQKEAKRDLVPQQMRTRIK